VELARLLAVSLAQFVLRRRGLDTEQVVEGHVCAVVGDNLVADSEYLVVCMLKLRLACVY
jgi:hypothetical protein